MGSKSWSRYEFYRDGKDIILQLSIMWNRDILLCFEISLTLLSLCPTGFSFLCLLLYKRSDVFAIYFTYSSWMIIGGKVSFIHPHFKTASLSQHTQKFIIYRTFEVLQAILNSIPFITFNPSIAASFPEDSSIPMSFSLFLQREFCSHNTLQNQRKHILYIP